MKTFQQNNRAHLEKLLSRGTVELRCFEKTQGKPVIWTGWYDTMADLVMAIKIAESRGMDAYNTINPIRLPATNQPLQAFQRAARDDDVTEIKTIFFDFDPVRETGTAATKEQVLLAVNQACLLVEYLETEGWGAPAFGFSGSGTHLYFYLEGMLPPTPGTKNALDGLYDALKLRFSTDEVKLDTCVKNPARIARCLGTTNTKADRRSSSIYCGTETPAAAVLALAEKITPPKEKPRHWVKTEGEQKAGKYIKNLDIVGLMQKNGLYLKPTKDAGKHWVTCPFAGEHSSTGPTDTIIFEGEWAQWSCSHNSCSGRDISDVIEVLTP